MNATRLYCSFDIGWFYFEDCLGTRQNNIYCPVQLPGPNNPLRDHITTIEVSRLLNLRNINCFFYSCIGFRQLMKQYSSFKFQNSLYTQTVCVTQVLMFKTYVVVAIDSWKHADFLCQNYILNGSMLYNIHSPIQTARTLGYFWKEVQNRNPSTKKFTRIQ